MAHTQDRRSALIVEGKRLVESQEATGWRLAEIVHELRDDGMTYQAIADELGWKQAASAQRHDRALLYRDTNDFSEAYVLGSVSEDRASAIRAISETEGLTLSATRSQRTPEIKAITAEIADLSNEEKEAVARELANDADFKAAVHRETERQHTRQKAERAAAEDRSGKATTPLQRSIDTARLRIAIGKAEQAAQAVLDGVTRDDLDPDEATSLERSSHRARLLADYIDAVLGVGDIDEAYAKLVEESA